jgi:hypothetical protein
MEMSPHSHTYLHGVRRDNFILATVAKKKASFPRNVQADPGLRLFVLRHFTITMASKPEGKK